MVNDNVKKEELLSYKLKQAEECEKAGRNFHAAHLYKDALEMARDLGKSDQISFLKQKLVATNQRLDGEMQSFSTNHEFSKEEIDQFNNAIIGTRPFAEILQTIGRCRELCPDYDALVEMAKRNQPVTFAFAKLSTISKDSHALKGGTDPDHSWLMQMYEFVQGPIFQIFLPNLFRELIHVRKLLNETNLIEYFKSTSLFSENALKILEIALNRYFAEDYISALHILVPQFEGFFLSVSEKLGIDTISLERTKEIATQTRTLSAAQLSSEAFQKVWGRDFCEQIKYILFEPMGYKLRHKVAHGEINSAECNFATNTLILQLFLVVAARVQVSKSFVKNE